MGLLSGKVAIITGAGGGIGRAHALLFAREGARVVVNDVGGARDGSGGTQAMAEAVCAEIRAAGGAAVPSADDVSERAGAERLIRTALDAYGQLDILVNNAGILRDKTLVKMDDAMFDAVLKVHMRGTYLCTQLAARHMIERGQGGRIINTTSVSGLMGNFGQSNYAAAKAGVYGFTRTAALELAKHRITVNAIAPIALTRMTEDLPWAVGKTEGDAQGSERSPEHVAPCALYLASDLAADVSGQIVAVEGPKMYLYKMIRTEVVLPRDGKMWSAEEIHARWDEVQGAPSGSRDR